MDVKKERVSDLSFAEQMRADGWRRTSLWALAERTTGARGWKWLVEQGESGTGLGLETGSGKRFQVRAYRGVWIRKERKA